MKNISILKTLDYKDIQVSLRERAVAFDHRVDWMIRYARTQVLKEGRGWGGGEV